MSFLTGTPAQYENVSNLLPYQQKVHQQKAQAASGALGNLQNYYGNLMSDNPEDFQAFAAPEMRRFNEQIVPDLAEQFAGMGSGGLSSSGFRNAAVSAGTDLSERLGAIRAQLRQQGAQGLQGLAQGGTDVVSSSQMTDPGSQGLLAQLAPVAGAAAGAFGGPLLGALGAGAANWITGGGNNQQQAPVSNSPSVQSNPSYRAPAYNQQPNYNRR